ncbi:MAG TPA: hypothetical protein VFU49_17325 [Ktedonobacteraceae bacterium]|nr:hypothetical protein [Ktedonobacteraceae bacterium]
MTNQRKPKVNARDLVARLNQESNALLQREIIAPLLPGGKIRTRLGGMIHEFKPRGEFVGWGRFRPVNEREAEVLGEAMPWERGGYLELFPALRMVLLWPDPTPERPGTWWALPFNDSDARQRFGFLAEPIPVFLCDPTNGAERFERVIVRVAGNVLWFDGPDALADPTHAEWLRDQTAKEEETEQRLSGLSGSERLALLYWQIRELEATLDKERRQQAEAERKRQIKERQRDHQRRLAWLRSQKQRRTLEERLQHALSKADAILHSYSEITNADGSLGHIVVEWSEQGHRHRYRSTIDPNLSVVSSGICLSGRDRDFDLTSLVNVMTDSPWA